MRYYFHLTECGVATRDIVGAELRDLAAARALAIQEARIVMCSSIKLGMLCLDGHIDIVDDEQRPLSTVLFRDAIEIRGVVAGALPRH